MWTKTIIRPNFCTISRSPRWESASMSSWDYVQLRAGELNEGARMYKFTVEVPSFRFLRPTVMKLRHRRGTMIWRSFARDRASTHGLPRVKEIYGNDVYPSEMEHLSKYLYICIWVTQAHICRKHMHIHVILHTWDLCMVRVCMYVYVCMNVCMCVAHLFHVLKYLPPKG